MTKRQDTSTVEAEAPTYFEEEQRFSQRQALSSLLITVSILPLVGLPLLLGKPSSLLLWLTLLVGVVAAALPAMLTYTMKLTTKVDSEYLHIRFAPFIRRDIPLKEISGWEARTYEPRAEYTGHGIKLGARGISYTVKGNRGVQLRYAHGKRLLLGSQHPEELAEAITVAKNKSNR